MSVSTDDIHEAIRATASALYVLAEEALGIEDDEDVEEHEFDVFLRDILGVLTRHADQLSSGELSQDALQEEDLTYD